MINRRSYVRVSAGIDFTYKIKGSSAPERREVTKNIGPGGIMGLVGQDIKNGDWLELNIDIPTLEKPVPAIGKVIWTADKNADKIDVGIKFEEVDPGMKNKFLEYLCELMFSKLENSGR